MASTPQKKPPLSINELVAKVSQSEIASINTVVQKLLEIIRNPNSSAMDLKKEIEVDPPLSAKLLRRANSAYFGVKRKISSIQEAIIFIGFNTVKEMAYSVKVGEFFSKSEEIGGYSRKRLWEHSVAVALLAKNIYRREFLVEGNEIYSLALLHDLGMIVEEQFLPNEFATVIDTVGKGNPTCALDVEQAVLGYTHCAIARRLMESWNFPRETVVPISFHHNPFFADQQLSTSPLTLFVAEQLCARQGLGMDPFIMIDDNGLAKALEMLKLNPKSVEIIAKDVVAEVGKMQEHGAL